VTQARIIVQII